MAGPLDSQRLLTAAVVFFGIVVLVLGKKAGLDPDIMTAGGATLVLVAGMMHSMILGKTETPPAPPPPPPDKPISNDDPEKKP